MKRIAIVIGALLLASTVSAVLVPTAEEFEALVVRVDALEARVTALETPSVPSPSPYPSPSPSPDPSPSPTTPPPSGGFRTVIGVASNDAASAVASVEAQVGAEFGAVRQNASAAYPLFFGAEYLADPGVYYRNVNIEDGGTSIWGGWAGVATSGPGDPAYEWYVQGLHDWMNAGLLSPTGPRLVLSIHHEQKVVSASQCGVGCNGDAADYKAMFAWFVAIAEQEGAADLIDFAFVPSAKQFVQADEPAWGVNVMDPGAELVEVYGADSYIVAQGDGVNKTIETSGIAPLGRYALERGRPALLGEFSVRANNAGGAAFLAECVATWKAQGNWLAILTDVDAFSSATLPVWQSTVDDPAFAWRGEFIWP